MVNLDTKKTLAHLATFAAGLHVERGSVTITGVGTSEKTTAVTFTAPYTTAPTVVVCFDTASYNRRVHVLNASTTGFDIVTALLSGSSTASCWVSWIAIGA